ncbi:serine/threonine protein kinase [Maudiozyma humilis]|uniref:non-specific serine/threonine protein kinase n=1 Tax=Maudiozyma humilis TaxID=51915 RepID=A0AAV5S2U5_MAUHU|nr:serine/threonine protein kinase [Kazachstania humilis]
MADSQDYEVLEEIGRGSFGAVRRVVQRSTGTVMVRKEIKYGHMNVKERQQLIAECRILAQLRHEHIVRFHSWDFDERGQVLYLYMEYCSRGDLQALIAKYRQEHKYMPEQTVWAVLAQLLEALYRCHYGEDAVPLQTVYDRMSPPGKHGGIVIHRDLKPGNVFLTGETSSSSSSPSSAPPPLLSIGTVKLGDFGLAKALGSSHQFATTYVGTPYYMSPEVLRDQPYSPLSDVWSLGCVVYEMCTLRPPFPARNYGELQHRIQQGNYAPLPDYYSQGLAQIIASMLKTDLKQRASTFELLQDIQVRTSRKALQLERFERNLLDYESELRSIEQLLERQALESERQGQQRVQRPTDSAYRRFTRPEYHWRERQR